MSRHFAWSPIDVSIEYSNVLTEKTEEENIEQDRHAKYRQPHSPTTAEEGHHKAATESLTQEQHRAVEEYKDGSARFNRPLRTGSKPSARSSRDIETLKTVTSKEIPYDSHGFRGFQKVNLSKVKVGDLIHDKGFTGVSRNYETAKGYTSEKDGNREEGEDANHYYVARIHMPAGTKGHYADQFDHLMTRENETILHPGTTFRVTGKSVSHEEKDGKDHFHHIVHMTVHHQK